MITTSHIFAFALSLFVLRNFFRHTRSSPHTEPLTRQLTKIVTEFFCLLVALVIFVRETQLLLVLAPPLTAFFVVLTKFWRQKRVSDAFHDEFTRFLEHTRLHLQIGMPFQIALTSSISLSTVKFQTRLKNICEAIELDQSVVDLKKYPDFLWIEGLSHIRTRNFRILESLSDWIQRLKIKSEIRQRSRQILWQARFQSFLMMALYLAMLLLVKVSAPAVSHQPALVLSLILFLSGSVWLQQLGRRVPWSI